ncbi:MAG: DUF5719 family protein, partial [Candidatus Geothermincolia bacterium]
APDIQGVLIIRRFRLLAFVLAVTLFMVMLPSLALAVTNGGSDALGCSTGPAKTWYFAEGTTRSGFNEYVCLLNPNGAVAVTEFTYMLGTGETIARRYELLPSSRTTINVNNEVPPGSDVSIRITSSEPVVAERPMYFNYQGAWDGGHVVLGANATSPDWYFAEGTTRAGFDSYLCLQNPGDKEASVELDYFLGDGTTRTRKDIAIKPASRFTVAVHEDGEGIGRHNDASGDFSVRVRTSLDTPLVAERAMYFNYKPYLTGGHDVFGATAPRDTWYFAEGTTRTGFDTYLCIANPGTKDAAVDISYFCGDGQQVEKNGIAVKSGSRLTIAAHEDALGIGRHDNAHGDFSARVRSTNEVPIVVERPSYFFYRPFWSGGHDVLGAEAPALQWYFAEGCTRQGFDTYLCLSNPASEKAVVTVQYFRGDNQVETRTGIEVAPGSRRTIAVHEVAEGIGRRDDMGGDVSIKVDSTNNVPVVAERPMYFAERWRTMDRTAIANAWGWGNRVYGNKTRPEVALTVDCENNANANKLMDILKQKGCHATFFLLDQIATSQPMVVTRMAFDGHEIANHGVTHAQFTKIPPSQVVWELGTVEEHVNQITGYTTKPYFRFPYGESNSGLINQVNGLGYFGMYWSVDPQEWRDTNSVDAVINNVLATSGPGAIILMHDSAKTIAAFPAIIDGLRARGLNPVSLTELMFPGP